MKGAALEAPSRLPRVPHASRPPAWPRGDSYATPPEVAGLAPAPGPGPGLAPPPQGAPWREGRAGGRYQLQASAAGRCSPFSRLVRDPGLAPTTPPAL